jgi:hypothetical protein
MAWDWPKIEDRSSAAAAGGPAVGVSGFVAAVSGLIAILSLPTASLYLVLTDLFEVAFNLATRKGGQGRADPFDNDRFHHHYVAAIRGTYAYHNCRLSDTSLEPPLAPLG